MLEISFKVSGNNPDLVKATTKLLELAIQAEAEGAALEIGETAITDGPKETKEVKEEAPKKAASKKAPKKAASKKAPKEEPEDEDEDEEDIFQFDIEDDDEEDENNSDDDDDLDTDDPEHTDLLAEALSEAMENKKNKTKIQKFLTDKLKTTSTKNLDDKGKKLLYKELKRLIG